MKVYQCIHKYPLHIPLFEKKYRVNDDMDFDTLHRLVIEDGYASTYILHPALQGRTDEVFYTIWDYQRLQSLWAREHGLTTNNLDEIKLAQIEDYQPDVFYNLSAFCDGGFISRLNASKSNMKSVYWNGIIEHSPGRSRNMTDIYHSIDPTLNIGKNRAFPHASYNQASQNNLESCLRSPDRLIFCSMANL